MVLCRCEVNPDGNAPRVEPAVKWCQSGPLHSNQLRELLIDDENAPVRFDGRVMHLPVRQ